VKELEDFNMTVDVHDSWASKEEVMHEYGIELTESLENGKYDAVILAVDHSETKNMGIDAIRGLCKQEHIVYDVKHVLHHSEADIRL
jgi:UDP-N-acetyl-D-galactosamine dehydrogenase